MQDRDKDFCYHIPYTLKAEKVLNFYLILAKNEKHLYLDAECPRKLCQKFFAKQLLLYPVIYKDHRFLEYLIHGKNTYEFFHLNVHQNMVVSFIEM